ncbi:helix-turn-helix transcriptional regulator [Actinoplanes sp. NPDC023936]|uniref:helix-turn-helix domain-containing protein n=1 Tax=Actinoplanes sp. NPDC023936 TaxID=3154910 RepID=UPI0033D85136
MTAPEEDLPAVARRRVRLALRRARDERGSSQGEIARELGWSLSKLQRIELGDVAVSPADVRVLLSCYGIGDEQLINRLVSDAKVARRERYWAEMENRHLLRPVVRQLMQFEEAATSVSVFQPQVVPGSLQTPETVHTILDRWRASHTDEESRALAESRARRRRLLTEESGAPEYRLLLDECVLQRVIGGYRTAAEQWDEVARVAERPNVRIRLLPAGEGAFAGAMGGFSLMQLDPNDSSDAVLYVESFLSGEIIQAGTTVEIYRKYFEEFWARALDETATTYAIRARAFALHAEHARGQGGQ